MDEWGGDRAGWGSAVNELASDPAQLSADLEGAWRAELQAAGHDDLVSSLSVSPREFMLGGHT